MTQLKIRLLAVISIASTISFNSFSPIYANTPTPAKQKTSCRIQIGEAHISTFLEKGGAFKGVEVNAYSICNALQRKTALTVRIYKVRAFGDRLIATSTTNPILESSSGLEVPNLGTSARCRSNNSARYYGIAQGQTVVDGQLITEAAVKSEEIRPLSCSS